MTCPIKILISSWTTEPKSDGVEMQSNSYNVIILKHIEINSQFRKILTLDSPIDFFFFFLGGGQSVWTMHTKNVDTIHSSDRVAKCSNLAKA